MSIAYVSQSTIRGVKAQQWAQADVPAFGGYAA